MRPPRLQRDEHGLSQTPRFALPLPMTAPSQHWPARAGQALPCTQTAREHMSRAASELISPRVSSLGRKTRLTPSWRTVSSPAALCSPRRSPAKTGTSGAAARATDMKPRSWAIIASAPRSDTAARESRRGGGLPVGDERVELGVDAAAADAAVAHGLGQRVLRKAVDAPAAEAYIDRVSPALHRRL